MKRTLWIIFKIAMVLLLVFLFPKTSQASETDSLVLNKKVSYNTKNNKIDVQLEAYSSGKILNSKKETDSVLVLDVSGSMLGSPLKALKEANIAFIDTMIANQKSLARGKYHTIQGVYYSTGANSFGGVYRTDNAEDMEALKAKINGLVAEGSTRPNLGLELAENMVVNNRGVEGREAAQEVLLFTDGEPDSKDIAKHAVNTAWRLKNNYEATIYSVGIQPGANVWGTSPTDVANSMLNGISSNYPNAKVAEGDQWSYLTLGTRVPNATYYRATNDINKLVSIFENIATPKGETIKSVLIKDILSNHVALPLDQKLKPDVSSLKVYQAWEYTTALTPVTTPKISYNETQRMIEVEKVNLEPVYFDQNDEPTAATKNNKLIIRYQVEPTPEFMGGNQVDLNQVPSGAYMEKNDGSEVALKGFEPTLVDLPISGKNLAMVDQKNYIGNNGKISQMLPNHLLIDGQHNQYVDITYSLLTKGKEVLKQTIKAGQPFVDIELDLTQQEEDTVYELQYEIEPSLSPAEDVGSAAVYSKENATTYLFRPEIKTVDRKIYLGNNLDTSKFQPTLEKWYHPQESSLSQLKFHGDAPTLTSSQIDVPQLKAEKETVTVNQVSLSNGKQVAVKVPFSVFVFRPEITSTNTTISYNQRTNLSERQADIAWKNSLTTTDGIEGDKPQLTIEPIKVGETTLADDSIPLIKTTDYYWKVTANGQGINNETAFINKTYSGLKPDDAHFTVYVKGQLTVKYLYDTGGEARPDKQVEGLVGEEYSIDLLDLAPLYELLRVEGGSLNSSNKVVGKFTEAPHTITFVYRLADVNLTVKYLLEDQSPVIDVRTKLGVPDKKVNNLRIGSTFDPQAHQLAIEGYDYVGIENTNGTTVPDKDFTIIFKYKGALKLTSVPDSIKFTDSSLITIGTKDIRPENDVTVEIMDTRQSSDNWELSLHLKDEFKNSAGRQFNGEVHFKDKGLHDITVTGTKSIVETRAVEVLGETTLKWDKKKEGLYLKQFAGNTKEQYQGTLVWTLSDGL